MMLRTQIALLTLVCTVGFATPSQAARTKPIANYTIQATLHPQTKTIQATQTLVWWNDSNDTISSLWFHLYMNAFQNEKSTFLQEWYRRGALGSFTKRMRKRHWGWTQIHSMKTSQGTDLTRQIRFVQPDDNNPHDRTVIRVALPQPIAPGAKITLQIKFTTRLPRAFARSGYRKNYFFVGQWYPKIGVYEKTGVRGAKQGRWNCHQYHATSEYYADFGRYHVQLTVPSNYVVGATGERRKTVKNTTKNTTTYTYVQEDVHDFAWTAYPHFRRIVRMFRFAKDVSKQDLQEASRLLNVSPHSLRLRDVKMVFLMQPSHMHLLERHVRALKISLKYYGLWYGEYPYSTITLVDPAWEGSERATSGMEYATLFTAGTSWLVAPKNYSLEHLIVHEFGHQIFQGLVATNEFEEAWLDEGVNTYTDIKIMNHAYPDQRQVLKLAHIPFPSYSIPWDYIGLSKLAYLIGNPKGDSIVRNSWSFQGPAYYGKNVYSKTGLGLLMLERRLGHATMTQALRNYVQQWRFKHPNSNDFIRSLSRSTRRNLRPYFQKFFYGTNTLDYAITSAHSAKVKTKAKGIFLPTPQHRPLPPKTTTTKTTLRNGVQVLRTQSPLPPKTTTTKTTPTSLPTSIRSLPSRPQTIQTTTKPKSTPSPKTPKKQPPPPRRRPPQKRTKPKPIYVTTVLVERKGEIQLSTELLFVFEDGHQIKRTWDGRYRWKRFSFKHNAKLKYAQVDPQHKHLLDIHTANNSKALKRQNRVALHWAVRLLFWFQNLLQLLIALL